MVFLPVLSLLLSCALLHVSLLGRAVQGIRLILRTQIYRKGAVLVLHFIMVNLY